MVRELIPSRGAVAEPLLLEVVRPLNATDLDRLAEAPKVGVPMIQRLRAIHHRQAQLLAEGKQLREVAAIVGCTPQRLTQLQTDPTFIELVGYYRDQIMVQQLEDSARLRDKLVDVGEMAVDELRERLEDDAARKRMGVDQLRKIGEFAMDRTVAPPKAAPMIASAPTAITISIGTAPVKRPDEPGQKTIDGRAETAGNDLPLPGEENAEGK
jgi:hypothetical protein